MLRLRVLCVWLAHRSSLHSLRSTHDEKVSFPSTGVILSFSESRGLLESLVVTGDSTLLSAADRLNGVQWDGVAATKSELAAYRYRYWRNGQAPSVGQPNGHRSDGAWGPWDTNWRPGGFSVQLRKRSGKWFVVDGLNSESPVGEILSTPQPSCADLPIR
jgi:hypothetical protein